MILRKLAAKSTAKQVKDLIAALNAHLETLNAEKEFNEEKLKADVEIGKKLMDQLSEKL
jgi:hypothetical protein